MEAKTKSGFSILQLVEIPEKYLRKGVLKELSGREVYVDTDEELGEQIFSGDVFEAIASEQGEMGDCAPAFAKMSAEDLAQIEALAEELGQYELIRVNKI